MTQLPNTKLPKQSRQSRLGPESSLAGADYLAAWPASGAGWGSPQSGVGGGCLGAGCWPARRHQAAAALRLDPPADRAAVPARLQRRGEQLAWRAEQRRAAGSRARPQAARDVTARRRRDLTGASSNYCCLTLAEKHQRCAARPRRLRPIRSNSGGLQVVGI
jgi:hypothetical protein